MKKGIRIISILIALCMILSPVSSAFSNIANAEELEETPFEFDEETGTITGYKGGNPPADLVIPEKIKGVKVKHIGDRAFYYSEWGGTINKQLNSVVLPEGLESLGYMAFQKNNLTEIKLPSTLTTLNQRSLAYNKLTTIEFPENLKSIGKEAFQKNEFTEIEIPSHIEEIEEGAFKNNKIEKVILHDGLKTIGAKAFEDNLIEEIDIPDTVVNWPSTNKDNSIFRRNGNGRGTLYLAKVYNNSGATAKNTFGIVNPASVTIEYKDTNGEKIKPSKTIVGKELKVAKKEGTGYRAPIVAVEGSGKELVNYDAEFGYKLIEVIDEISENYYQIGREYIFEPEEIEGYELPESKTVKLDNKENTITFIYKKVGQEPQTPVETEETPFEFDEETGTITGYKENHEIPSKLEIPETINNVDVKHIGNKAFYKQKNIKQVSFPQTLETIGEEAFRHCELGELYLPGNIKEIKDDAFNNCGLTKITFEEGLEKLGSNSFSNNSIIETMIPDTVKEWPSEGKGAVFSSNKVELGNWTGKIKFAKVYNNSGATAKNTFGIVNPALVAIEYKDTNGKKIKPNKTIVGKELKSAKNLGTNWDAKLEIEEGSKRYLTNYDEPYDIGHHIVSILDEISENYYQIGREYTFEPEEIEGYELPESKTVKLDNKENTITFIYKKEGQEPVEDLTKPASIELSFPGGKQVTPLNPGGKQIINVKVFNGKDEEVKDEKVTFESSDPDVLKHSFLDTFTAGEVEEETEVTITAILKSNPVVTGKIKVTVSPKKQEVVDLDEEIDFLKKCYKAYMTEDSNGNTGSAGLSMLAPGAARLAGMDVEEIQNHLYIDDKNKSAYQVSQSIITLIGADLDPRQYDDKDKVRNLVQELVDGQKDSGEFILDKGITGNRGDQNSIEAQARSIIALDMAGAKYDEEKAVSKLIEIYDRKDSHTYKDIETEGIVLVALSNHKNVKGVQTKINEILDYLKTKQNKDAGFDVEKGSYKGKNSPIATGRVIQGLIANGINPLEDEEWIKNGSTMLDAIVKSKTVKDNMKLSGYGKGEEDEYTYYKATYTAFGALIDLKNQKSMFELLKLEVDTDVEPNRVEISKPNKDKMEVGESIVLTAKVYDKDGKALQGQELIWKSSDKDIITVKDGNIEAKKAGKAAITVKVKETEIQDTFKITVIDEVKTLDVNTAIIVFDKDGNYEKKSNPQKVTINKDDHDGGFTAFGALQATTSEYEGDGWITSIYKITGPSTGGWMFNVNGKIPNVGAKEVKLEEGDKIIWFCTYDWKRDKAPQWSELTDEEPEEKVTIKIISNKTSVKAGERLPLTAEVHQGDKLTSKEIMWLSGDAEIATIDEDGKVIAHKAGEVTITAALVEDKNIKDTIKIKVVEEDEKDLTIEEVIESLRKYYSNKDKFTFRQAIGYNHTSDKLQDDLLEISSKFKTNEEPKSASEHVGNIIGLIAAGKDPFNHNNKNYVEPLVKSQNKEGKFIIGKYDDYSTVVAFSVLALDMADAEYNSDKAVEALLGYQKDDGSFGGVDETGMVLTALAKYKDKSKVQDAINKGLEYLKEQQDENTGGFIVWGGENPYSASAVIQGLIAVGEEPLSKEWTKNGKTIIDSLMNFYEDGYFEKESEWSDVPDIDMVTEQAFIALADVYRGKSMFNEIKFNTNKVAVITIDKPSRDKILEGETIRLIVKGYDSSAHVVPVSEIIWTSSNTKIAEVDSDGKLVTKKPGKVTITAEVKDTGIKDSIDLEINKKEIEIDYIGDVEVRNGQQTNAKVRLRNLTEEIKPTTLIVALYDKKTNRLLNYSIVKKELESKEELELAAGFLIPDTGNYYIKGFLWDDLKHQNIIMKDAKEIKVAN